MGPIVWVPFSIPRNITRINWKTEKTFDANVMIVSTTPSLFQQKNQDDSVIFFFDSPNFKTSN